MKIFKILKRWLDMLSGKSIYHVRQGEGKYYSKEKVYGYYNDMTKKVNNVVLLDDKGIPISKTINGVIAYFPITIFQYGLGLFDLYIETKNSKYIQKFINIANWTLENQKEDGMWNCMGTLNDTCHKTQSSMCQSEAVSVLLRSYIHTGDEKYLIAAKKGIDFMILDVKKGGTCSYYKKDVIFQEYVSNDNLSVLNGWIFSIFGLYDYTLINNDKKYKMILENSINSLVNNLSKYDRGFWTNYDMRGTIASPAYHDIHIAQLKLLFNIFGLEEFRKYSEKWKKYQNNKFYILIAMFIKMKQKIFRSKYYDINTSLVS